MNPYPFRRHLVESTEAQMQITWFIRPLLYTKQNLLLDITYSCGEPLLIDEIREVMLGISAQLRDRLFVRERSWQSDLSRIYELALVKYDPYAPSLSRREQYEFIISKPFAFFTLNNIS